jgi:hypothetical protein
MRQMREKVVRQLDMDVEVLDGCAVIRFSYTFVLRLPTAPWVRSISIGSAPHSTLTFVAGLTGAGEI